VATLYEHSELLDLDGARVCVVRLAGAQAARGRHALLLHGNPSNLDTFQGLVPAVLPHASATLCDHPGFGRSTAFSAGRVTLERSARLAFAVLDAGGQREGVDVIGHSHGALVAIAMAALAPARVRSLVLLASGGTPAHAGYRILRSAPELATILPSLAARLYRGRRLARLARRFTALAASSSFAPGRVPARFVDEQVRDLAARPDLLRSMVEVALDDPCRKVAGYAPRVRAPVLFVHGAGDALVRIEYPRRLFALFSAAPPASRFVTVAGGHMVHMTHPERVAPLIEDWLASV
jgi:pimeloyl-ACP methyl ester carboxylesterase